MKQSLEDQMAADTKDMNEEKSAKAAADEGEATAEGDLATTVAELKEANQALATSNSDCMTTAADHEATVAARNEELKVIATAEFFLKESTSGAVGQTYSSGMCASLVFFVDPWGVHFMMLGVVSWKNSMGYMEMHGEWFRRNSMGSMATFQVSFMTKLCKVSFVSIPLCVLA
jgi:hypothetical protein